MLVGENRNDGNADKQNAVETTEPPAKIPRQCPEQPSTSSQISDEEQIETKNEIPPRFEFISLY